MRSHKLGNICSSLCENVVTDFVVRIAKQIPKTRDGPYHLAAGERTSTEFQLAKYSGSDSEINDTILELFSPVQLDAAFISSSSSSEALLTSMLVCHESLKPNGVMGLCSNLLLDSEMVRAVSSFRDLLGDAYHEISHHVFAKA